MIQNILQVNIGDTIVDTKKIEHATEKLIEAIEEDASREGLKDTPKRVARMYKETLEGYNRSLEEEMTVFENTQGYNDIIYSGCITFYSLCEHHLVPFFGKAYVAYIPNGKIAGLSKLARAVDIYARRLQDQERITVQVANELSRILEAQGVAVLLEGQHFCNMARGTKQESSNMKTMCFLGSFKEDKLLRQDFLSLI